MGLGCEAALFDSCFHRDLAVCGHDLSFLTAILSALHSPLLGEWLVCAASIRGYHSPSVRTESIFKPSLCLSDMVGLYLMLWNPLVLTVGSELSPPQCYTQVQVGQSEPVNLLSV